MNGRELPIFTEIVRLRACYIMSGDEWEGRVHSGDWRPSAGGIYDRSRGHRAATRR